MKINIDMEKYNTLSEKSSCISKEIRNKKEELDCVQKEIKKLFPKGYWWAFDIDDNWKRPKKYSIREVCDGYVYVKEVFKKAPWQGFTGISRLSFEKLFRLDIYKTEEEAKVAAYNRPCPKCGGPMKYGTDVWCGKCMRERYERAEQYRKTHTFYDPKKKCEYEIKYTDELTRDKGFYGRHFKLKRLDTGEIIETDNLWSWGGAHENIRNLPLIEFINEEV